MFYTETIGTDGFMRWAWDNYVYDMHEDISYRYWEPDDGWFIYPVERENKDIAEIKFYSTPRYEMLKQGMRDYEKARFLLSNSNISEDVKENLRNSIKVDLPIGGNNGYGSKTYQNQEERMRVHNQTTLAYDKINEVAIKHLELIHPLVNRDLLREKVESITAELLGEDGEFTEETKAKYTEVSLNNLKEKLDIAKEVLINDDVEQNQVDVALSNLNSAYVELELIPDVQPEIQNTKGFIIGTTNIRVEPNGPIIGTLKKVK
ncbi:MAG: DUF4091 domain-containing protein [Helcococcus sp.]|nr:DUF4091 domain-containing protein [Helcococcus sp.]